MAPESLSCRARTPYSKGRKPIYRLSSRQSLCSLLQGVRYYLLFAVDAMWQECSRNLSIQRDVRAGWDGGGEDAPLRCAAPCLTAHLVRMPRQSPPRSCALLLEWAGKGGRGGLQCTGAHSGA